MVKVHYSDPNCTTYANEIQDSVNAEYVLLKWQGGDINTPMFVNHQELFHVENLDFITC